MNLSIIFPILFLVISIIFSRSERVQFLANDVEFYPVQGVNPIKASIIYGSSIYQISKIPLLIYLANKGYIKICEKENKALFSKFKTWSIKKEKDYDGEDEFERIFIDELFSEKNEIMYSDFRNKLKDIGLKITNSSFDKGIKEQIFQRSGKIKIIIIFIMIFITSLIINYKLFTSGYELGITIWINLAIPMGLLILILSFLILKESSIVTVIISFICGLIFFGVPFIICVVPLFKNDVAYKNTYIIGILCMCIMIIIAKKMNIRTEYGNMMFAKILGLRKFIRTGKREKIEELLLENENYFYDILPFAYTSQLSREWIDKFQHIPLKAPCWYESTTDEFDFNNFRKELLNSVNSVYDGVKV